MSVRPAAALEIELPPVLCVERLSVALPADADRPFAVEDVNLSIVAGQTLCIVGESGSGKSVLASAVMALLPSNLRVASGTIRIDGEVLNASDELRMRALRGARMGMVFQEPMTALNPSMRCGDQLAELLVVHPDLAPTTPSDRRARVLQMFERVRLPDPPRIARSYPHQLSGGQRQRVVIALAMLLRPRLLICDEPTTALDVTTQQSILALIDELSRNEGTAVLFITHDMGVVADIADHVLVMRHGRVVEQGERDRVLRAPTEPYTRALLAAVPSMQPPPMRPRPATAPILVADQVSMRYTRRDWLGRSTQVDALQQACVSLGQGETVGVVGESGCGKTTLARCVTRLLDPTAGSIRWGADEVAHLSEPRLRPLRSRVQVVFQDPNRSLNPRLTVGASIVEGAMNFGVSARDAWQQARALMDRVRLPVTALDRYPHQFSGGQRQRIAIARALASQPDVVVADEAVSALDVSVQAEVLRLLREIRDEYQLGLLFITHDLRVAAQLCDRIVVMHAGQVVETGATHEVYARPQHDYTRRLLAAAPKGPESVLAAPTSTEPAA
jgi:peptide/nickel transport system ATP-binding protein